MGQNEWSNDPRLKNMPPEKIQFLQMLAAQADGKKQKELMPILLAAASQAKSKGIHFEKQEFSLIVEVLKSGKSPEELKKIEQLLSMAASFHKK